MRLLCLNEIWGFCRLNNNDDNNKSQLCPLLPLLKRHSFRKTKIFLVPYLPNHVIKKLLGKPPSQAQNNTKTPSSWVSHLTKNIGFPQIKSCTARTADLTHRKKSGRWKEAGLQNGNRGMTRETENSRGSRKPEHGRGNSFCYQCPLIVPLFSIWGPKKKI